MHLIRINCCDFRNLSHVEFEPKNGVNVICGKNGQGKTNLLESIFLLTGAKSFRSAKDRDLIKKGEEAASVDAEFFKENRTRSMRLTVSEKGRGISLAGDRQKKASSAAGEFCCVVFSPEHLMLVKGSPELRRRFIDTALFQLSPRYASCLKNYVKTVAQRNRLLKDSAFDRSIYDMLDVYDEQISESAYEVIKYRKKFVKELLPIARETYRGISDDSESIGFRYQPTLRGETPDDLLLELRSLRQRDLRAGFCTAGPHRDDLEISLNDSDSRVFASQGQQRCIVLSLKLSEAKLMKMRLDEEPVLLLDDVLSELDEKRCGRLIEVMSGSQAIITSCSPKSITSRTDAEVFVMSGGGLTRGYG